MMEEETSKNRTLLKSTSIRIGRVNIDHVYHNGMTLYFNHFLDLCCTVFGIVMLFFLTFNWNQSYTLVNVQSNFSHVNEFNEI